MIPRKEDRGDFPSLKLDRTRVMGMVEQARLEGFGDGRPIVTQHAGNESHDRVGQHKGPQHAVGEDVVADRDLIVHEMVGHTLVDPLVMTAKQDQVFRLRILADDRLFQGSPLGREEDHLGPGSAEFGQRGGDRFDLHHHAGTAAVRGVVDRAVAVMGPSAQIDGLESHQPGLLGTAKDTLAEDALGDGGYGGQDLDLEHFENQRLAIMERAG